MKGIFGFGNVMKLSDELESVLRDITVNAWVVADGVDTFHHHVRLDGKVLPWGHSDAPEKNGLKFRLTGPKDRAVIEIKPEKGGQVEFEISKGRIVVVKFTSYAPDGKVSSLIMIAGFPAE